MDKWIFTTSQLYQLFYNLIIKLSIIHNFKMNRKQSHQPTPTYSQSYYPKTQYQQTSPYMQLLQNKKAVQGYRYDTKNIRSFTNYVKPSQNSISSIFSQKGKPFKTISTQKQKVKVVPSTNEKRKRTRTEQAQQKMHQSMCIYPAMSQKLQDEHINKSVNSYNYMQNNYLNMGENNGMGNNKKMQSTQFHPSNYFQQLSNSANKNKRKRHLSQNKHNHSQNSGMISTNANGNPSMNASQQHVHNSSHNFHKDRHGFIPENLASMQGIIDCLNINDIDGLITLIDNCVSEANQYITYLSEKMNDLKQELILSKQSLQQQHQETNKKELIIAQKDQLIQQLERKNNQLLKQPRKQNGFEVKNLLQIIEKLSDENERLRTELQDYKCMKNENKNQKQVQRQKQKQKQRRDYYNEIHSKIDILNISIDNNHTFHGASPSNGKQKEKEKQKQKLDRQLAKRLTKQYKFIKPRGK